MKKPIFCCRWIFKDYMYQSGLYILTTVLFLGLATTSYAMEIANRVGITARSGVFMPSDSRTSGAVVNNLTTDNGIAFNGGVILGLANPNDNLAVELESTYSKFNFNFMGFKLAEIKSYDISLGLQYRFITSNGPVFSPYLGLGLDLLLNDIGPAGDAKIDLSYGSHVKLGSDFFVSKHVAINTEVKGVWGAKANLHDYNVVLARYNPSSICGLIGLRYFIN